MQVNDYAPANKRTTWMTQLQASVPVGVMLGYVCGFIVAKYAGSNFIFGTECWRIVILAEVCLLTPFCFGFLCIPRYGLSLKFNALSVLSTHETMIVNYCHTPTIHLSI